MGLHLLSGIAVLLGTTVSAAAQTVSIPCDQLLAGCGLGIGSSGQSGECTCLEFVPECGGLLGTTFCALLNLRNGTATCCECEPGMSSTWSESEPDPRNCTSERNLREVDDVVTKFEKIGKKIQKKYQERPDCINDSFKRKEAILSRQLKKLNKQISIECWFVSASDSSSQSCD